jgi:hypothetical protein
LDSGLKPEKRVQIIQVLNTELYDETIFAFNKYSKYGLKPYPSWPSKEQVSFARMGLFLWHELCDPNTRHAQKGVEVKTARWLVARKPSEGNWLPIAKFRAG